ncbi:uncharacterized protein troap isoform X2 [Entelurus aequoreus]|uniref:uncharacterized protein troap isoform X2 n=1 Tax=Entelurus aequoreus TaxID=161455 RepID=UPI002B1E20E1|nr:uncharacterized protein troap isoform X2 [Entelurus aequoreus]
MDSSPVLRAQSHNKIRTDCLRIKSENNKMPVDPKNLKPVPALHLPNKESENQDPAYLKRSRLPVLVKSLRPSASDFTQWEEKALTGKAKKKKPYTRPMPFDGPQKKKAVVEALQPRSFLQSRRGPRENNVLVKTQNITAKPSKCPAGLKSTVDSNKGKLESHGMARLAAGQCGHSDTYRTKNFAHQSSVSDSVEVCLDHMTHLSLKEPTKLCYLSQNVRDNLSNDPSVKSVEFSADPGALRSILQNTGVKAGGPLRATPQNSSSRHSSIYTAQRVPVRKHLTETPNGAIRVKSVEFSADPGALRSILQNTGVKAGGPLRATPQNSSSRHSSIYTAQRVPVRKHLTETPKGAIRENIGTPQRLPNTRHQPVSAMKFNTPMTPWLRDCNTKTPHREVQRVPVRNNLTETAKGATTGRPQRIHSTRRQPMSAMKFNTPITPRLMESNSKTPHREEIVQRLFDDQEDGQSATKDGTQKALFPVDASPIQTHCEEKTATNNICNNEEEAKPFMPALPRESVIFYSTGEKMVRTAHFEKQERSVHQERHGPATSELGEVCDPIRKVNTVGHIVHKDQKTCVTNTAVALLRKGLPLAELRLDEEVSMYTSLSVSDDHAFSHPRPRCGNPVAFLLYFEESTRFVPLNFEASP